MFAAFKAACMHGGAELKLRKFVANKATKRSNLCIDRAGGMQSNVRGKKAQSSKLLSKSLQKPKSTH